MGTLYKFLLELAALGVVLSTFMFVSWTKMTLGAFMAALGAFFPRSSADKNSGRGRLKIGNVDVSLNGSLRVGVLFAGLFLLASECWLGWENSASYRRYSNHAASEMQLFTAASSREAQVSSLGRLHETLVKMQEIKRDPVVESQIERIEFALARKDPGGVLVPAERASIEASIVRRSRSQN